MSRYTILNKDLPDTGIFKRRNVLLTATGRKTYLFAKT